jgi:hypothetical protein
MVRFDPGTTKTNPSLPFLPSCFLSSPTFLPIFGSLLVNQHAANPVSEIERAFHGVFILADLRAALALTLTCHFINTGHTLVISAHYVFHPEVTELMGHGPE